MRACFLTMMLALAASACGGPAIDLKTALQVQDVSTGWLDEGVVNGQNKIVPSVTFKFKNATPIEFAILFHFATGLLKKNLRL